MSIHRLGHISLTVTDLDRAARFAEQQIGLRVTDHEGDRVYLTSNERHHQLILEPGATSGCAAIAFDVDGPDSWTEILGKVRDAGYTTEVHDGRDHTERVFSFSIPEGPTFEICHGADTVPVTRYSTLGIRPLKLGHVTLAAPDPAELEHVAGDLLGFRLSDRLPLGDFATGDLTWYRCGTDHHCLGLTPGPAGLHHYAWQLPDFASFAPLADHLSQNDIRFIWGPGRHGPGDNIFAYYEDSEGAMVEVYADMLQIMNDAAYVPTAWSGVEASGNLWGPLPVPEWFEYTTPYVASRRDLTGTTAVRS